MCVSFFRQDEALLTIIKKNPACHGRSPLLIRTKPGTQLPVWKAGRKRRLAARGTVENDYELLVCVKFLRPAKNWFLRLFPSDRHLAGTALQEPLSQDYLEEEKRQKAIWKRFLPQEFKQLDRRMTRLRFAGRSASNAWPQCVFLARSRSRPAHIPEYFLEMKQRHGGRAFES